MDAAAESADCVVIVTDHDGVDYAADGHTLLSLHANAAITFDLAALREAGAPAEMKFTATAGYFGQTPKNGASYFVYVDAELKANQKNFGRDDGGLAVDVLLPNLTRRKGKCVRYQCSLRCSWYFRWC